MRCVEEVGERSSEKGLMRWSSEMEMSNDGVDVAVISAIDIDVEDDQADRGHKGQAQEKIVDEIVMD